MNKATEIAARFAGRPRLALVVAGGLLLVAASLLAAAPASAQVWNEVGDAGDLPGTAQTTVGNGPLTTIHGSAPTDAEVDMYCIRINDRATFLAGLNCLIQLQEDLYLFDSTGKGIALAQVCAAGEKQLTNAFVPSSGLYYLAVAWHGALAQSGANAIWLAGLSPERAPDGPGSAGVVTSWGGNPVSQIAFSNYTIVLTGATFCDPLVTPVLHRSWGHLKSIYR